MTTDVDLLVSRRDFNHIKAGIGRHGYMVQQFPHVLKVYIPGEPVSVADIVVHESDCVLSAAFSTRVPGVILGFPASVVQRGVFVAMKFQAVVTLRRLPRDRTHDVLDIRGVLQKEFGPEDERQAIEFARMMHPGAEAELKTLICDLRNGRWPMVARRAENRRTLLVRSGLAALRRRGGPSRHG